MKPLGRMGAWAALCGCLVLTLAAMAGGGALVSSAVGPFVEARSWKQVSANIESAIIDVTKHGRTERRVCHVVYSYRVDGTIYRGNRASLYQGGSGTFDAALCRSLARQQEAGDAVAYYDPADPQHSVLNRYLRHDVFCSALLILLFLGGAGLCATIHYAENIAKRRRLLRRTIIAEERKWPALSIALTSYCGALAILSGVVGFICVFERDWAALWTLGLASVYSGATIYCAMWAFRSKASGALLLSELADGSAILRIPWRAEGDATLTLQWAYKNAMFEALVVGKKWDLRVPDVKDGDDGWSQVALVVLPEMPHEMVDHSEVELNITGYVGERKYNGRFCCGPVVEFKEILGSRSLP